MGSPTKYGEQNEERGHEAAAEGEPCDVENVTGRREACATLSRRGGTGWGKAGVGVLFCHECFEAGTPISNGNE